MKNSRLQKKIQLKNDKCHMDKEVEKIKFTRANIASML